MKTTLRLLEKLVQGGIKNCHNMRIIVTSQFDQHEQEIPPEGSVASLLERFSSGNVSAMMGLYAPEAVFIAKDGRIITDHAEIAADLEGDFSLGLPLKPKARHVFVADDVAQIVLDCSIDGAGPDGKHGHLGGSASDIVRRGADRLWRYLMT